MEWQTEASVVSRSPCSFGSPRAWAGIGGSFVFFWLGQGTGLLRRLCLQFHVMAPLLIPWEKQVHFKEGCYFLSLLCFSLCPSAYVLESSSFTYHYCKVFYIPSVPPSLSKGDPSKCCHLHTYFYSPPPVTKDLKYYTAVRPDRCYIALLL